MRVSETEVAGVGGDQVCERDSMIYRANGLSGGMLSLS
jgi:hypothetical protein